MGVTKYDFSGWATKNNLRCSDGRTIRNNAFKHNDGKTVPLVWQHLHNEPTNVIGHCLLENRDEGVYCWGIFNDTDQGQHCKSIVRHGDVDALSIYANNLDQRGGDVYHGDIKEVSLVLAGANPGALIDYPIIEHSGEESYDEAVIYTGELLEHSDKEDDEEDKEDKKKSSEEDVDDEINKVDGKDKDDDKDDDDEDEVKHADSDVEGKTIQEVFDTLNDDQKDAVYAMLSEALNDDEENSEGGDDEMKHNVFDVDTKQENPVLTHDDFQKIFADAKRLGSLKDAVLQHMEEGGVLAHSVTDRDGNTVEYGIADIDYLFPDAKEIDNVPQFISRDMGWVAKVMSATHHTPFSRVKSTFANITMEEARAKGYIKGNKKKEEVFALLKRATDPQTIYKKQKLDRDDVIDIADFDVVAWLKREMRMMLDEEIARAILIGDGRSSASEDKISEDHIRSILNDSDLYTIKVGVTSGSDDEATAKNFIKSVIKSRKLYKGSGNPTLFITEDLLTNMLLIEDTTGRAIYETEAALATKLRVKEIVTVPVMEELNESTAILVNLSDYNIGADKGGAVSMFDDFDIDYNQMKYLIETRISGALVKPYSAVAFTVGGSNSSTEIPTSSDLEDEDNG